MSIKGSKAIQTLPKIEMHLHLEGAVRLQTLRELSNLPMHSDSWMFAENVGKMDRYDGLGHFVLTMRTLMDTCLRKPEHYERLAYELFIDLSKQNVIYTEVSFDPFRGLRLKIPFDEMLEAVYNAKVRAERENKIKIGLIIGLGREREPSVVADFARKAADSKKFGIIGLDLHGNEEAAPPEDFLEAYDIAGSAGLGLRAHAGEGTGTESIWGAIKALKVSRIAHGVRAVEDPSLVEYLKANPITLDLCLSSNYKLGIVDKLSEHPIRYFFDQGIKVTVSTDDPFFFDTSMNREYEVLTEYLGFTVNELKQINLYAVDGAFLKENEKSLLKREIEQGYI